MLVSMNSKRQRRPNVRLGEIGNISAAVPCVAPQKSKEHLEPKRWKHAGQNPGESGFSMQSLSECRVSDAGVSAAVAVDMQQNRENRNPNSLKSVFEFGNSDENNANKRKLDFGTVIRKGRLMKRRGRSMRGNTTVSDSVWNCGVSPEISNEDADRYSGGKFDGPMSHECYDVCIDNALKYSSDHGTSEATKGACANGWAEPTSDAWLQGDTTEIWKDSACNERDSIHSDDDLGLVPKYSVGFDKMGICDGAVNGVRRWLEELGFGKYAGIFEMHEVDEEALPLLTFEDLKEMGIHAVGPRRKMYTAIKNLREGGGVSN